MKGIKVMKKTIDFIIIILLIATLSSAATRIYMINTAQPDRPCKITWSGETTTYDQNY